MIGIAAGVVCYYAIQLKNKLHWDDALDVWGVHGVGGLLGIVLLGVFAGTAINPYGAQGLIHGSGSFFGKQLAAGAGCSLYAFLFTDLMLRVIDLITPVRVGTEAERGPRRGHARRKRLPTRARDSTGHCSPHAPASPGDACEALSRHSADDTSSHGP